MVSRKQCSKDSGTDQPDRLYKAMIQAQYPFKESVKENETDSENHTIYIVGNYIGQMFDTASREAGGIFQYSVISVRG